MGVCLRLGQARDKSCVADLSFSCQEILLEKNLLFQDITARQEPYSEEQHWSLDHPVPVD